MGKYPVLVLVAVLLLASCGPVGTPIPQQTAQPIATVQEQAKGSSGAKPILNMDRKTMGLALILICGVGLALMIIGIASKDKKPPKKDL